MKVENGKIKLSAKERSAFFACDWPNLAGSGKPPELLQDHYPLSSRLSFTVRRIHRKIADEGRCRSCGVPHAIHPLDAAHTIPKSLGGKATYDSVIPLCRACHDAQHRREIELLPLMTREEEMEAVRAVGLARAYRYLTGGNRLITRDEREVIE